MTLAVGTVLVNRYRIARQVGQGGFGAVYRAWDTVLDKPVALKENSDTGVESQRQFEREAKLLANLRHLSLPVVGDHFILPGQGQYLVMDFVEGQSLKALLLERGGPLDEMEVLPWIRRVCDALDYLHSRTPPIIHRDIKPDNIIITPEGRAVLVDFGISKAFDPNRGTTAAARAVTAGYSPPEQYAMGKTDARSDVYALGATLYTLLTGVVPPEGPSLSSGLVALTPPRQVNPLVSEGVSAAIMAAMAPTISQRLHSAGSLSSQLAAASNATPTPARTAVMLPSSAPAKPRHPGWRWPAITAVIAVLALAGGLIWRPWESPAAIVPVTATIETVAVIMAPSPTAELSPTVEPTPTDLPPTAATSPTAAPTATTGPLGLRTVSRSDVDVDMVLVPAGSFRMGSPSSEDNERPVHTVALDEFWIDQTEVTNRQFRAFVAETGYVTTAERVGGGTIWDAAGNWGFVDGVNWLSPHGPDTNIVGLDDHPVVQVSWDDAVAFCTWAGGRLPTEAEWEYAARGPENLAYPWGDSFDPTQLNYCDVNCTLDWRDDEADDGYTFTAPVNSFTQGASWVGAVDMAGNVWEWVTDWYGPTYYVESAASNPGGPPTGEMRGLRGGSWDDTYDWTRSAFRYHYAPERSFHYLGFRCVQ